MQLKEKREEIEKLKPMLTAKEKELTKVQSLERTEKQDIERMTAELA